LALFGKIFIFIQAIFEILAIVIPITTRYRVSIKTIIAFF